MRLSPDIGHGSLTNLPRTSHERNVIDTQPAVPVQWRQRHPLLRELACNRPADNKLIHKLDQGIMKEERSGTLRGGATRSPSEGRSTSSLPDGSVPYRRNTPSPSAATKSDDIRSELARGIPGTRWLATEIALICDGTLSDVDIADLTGRSAKAVTAKRARLAQKRAMQLGLYPYQRKSPERMPPLFAVLQNLPIP